MYFYYNAVLLRSSINVLWTMKLHLTFPQHKSAKVMTDLSFFFVNLSFKMEAVPVVCVFV